MKTIHPKTLAGVVLVGSAALAGGAEAALVTFNGMPAAVYGKANDDAAGGAFSGTGSCNQGNCWLENGVVVGGVYDPTDAGAHYHRQGTAADREAQYHPDSTGIFVRRDDKTNFSLQSIDLNVTNGVSGGNFVIYGYASAANMPKLLQSTPFSGGANSSTDPDWGSVSPVATYVFPNDGSFNQTVNLATLGPTFGDIGAFWLHYQGFNHSPTTNYTLGSYPDWDLRIDDINLGAPVVAAVPVPAAFWLFGAALSSLVTLARRKVAA